MAKEEWQNPDSGYLNCIGVGDTYVKKQMERIMYQNILDTNFVAKGFICSFSPTGEGVKRDEFEEGKNY